MYALHVLCARACGGVASRTARDPSIKSCDTKIAAAGVFRSAEQMADKLRFQAQLEQLQQKYVGTGHADTTKYEWLANQHRDTYASCIGHPSLLNFFAVASNDSVERVRLCMIEKMILPCGLPIVKDDT
ncbi:unnamed protein product [Pneumocystis jirovecii]|uniref:Splicing factor subunit n=1 Tax=Pneumocystis jirovecii TaxID=42068 RepID=L0PGR9_PNEJI|nr:unnamed protein product [Pneumocystis jirovecii]